MDCSGVYQPLPQLSISDLTDPTAGIFSSQLHIGTGIETIYIPIGHEIQIDVGYIYTIIQ